LLVCLWGWVAVYARSGRVPSRYVDALVAALEVAPNEREHALDVLVETGFLNRDRNGVVAHGFLEHNGRQLNEMERKRRERERARTVRSVGADSPQTVHGQSAPTDGTDVTDEQRARKDGGVSAATLGRLRERFPTLDIESIEAKLVVAHQERHYRSLDRAMVAWCQKAEANGWDRRAAAVASNGALNADAEAVERMKRLASAGVKP
jgi:hypothetical protein